MNELNQLTLQKIESAKRSLEIRLSVYTDMHDKAVEKSKNSTNVLYYFNEGTLTGRIAELNNALELLNNILEGGNN